MYISAICKYVEEYPKLAGFAFCNNLHLNQNASLWNGKILFLFLFFDI